MTYSPFLKRVLILDAVSCVGMGVVLAFGAGALAPYFGLGETLQRGAGLFLVLFGLAVAWLGARKSGPAAAIYALIAANLIWASESATLIAMADAITPLGTTFVAIQGLAVAGLAVLEWVGARRARQVKI